MLLPDNKNYSIIDEFEPLSIQDCFVKPIHKIGIGHGEGKFYIGNDDDEAKNRMKFFWGFTFADNENTECRCCILKSDLKQYLKVMEIEYIKPKLPYDVIKTNAGRNKFQQNKEYVENLVENMADIEWFSIKRTLVTHSGVYVNSTKKGSRSRIPADGYELQRHVIIPIISSMQIYKLRCEEDDGKYIYYWRPYPDFEAMANPERLLVLQYSEAKRMDPDEKNKLIQKYLKRSIQKDKRYREGQTVYRKKLVAEFEKCPLTGISSDSLLIASHIKPYAICCREKENNNDPNIEYGMYDPNNGLLLSPLFDKLFDKGLITFDDNGNISFSSYINENEKTTILKGCSNGFQKIDEAYMSERRKEYLDYHRKYVFHK